MATELMKRGNREVFPFPGFGRFFDDMLTTWPAQNTRGLRPAMDIVEDEDKLTVKTELPGIPKDEVHVMIEDGVLTITGEKKSDREEKNRNFHLVERTFGSFHRSITLPTGVEADKAEASFVDGVLVIDIPKSEHTKPRKIDIN
ncbi:MAG: Hsp20/alpha crystallin family protein [Planctomycetota bacterium]|nr:Hsp20/alpha crystallin family protein [Planctomycetota bacterium]